MASIKARIPIAFTNKIGVGVEAEIEMFIERCRNTHIRPLSRIGF